MGRWGLAFVPPVGLLQNYPPAQTMHRASPRSAARRTLLLHSTASRACADGFNAVRASPRAADDATAETDALVRELWARLGDGAFGAAAPLFRSDAVYHDTLYPAPFVGAHDVGVHLRAMERVFVGRGLRFVVDDLAAADRVAAVRWHVALRDGRHLPFGRGASTYRAARDESTGALRFTEAWDFPEPTLKIAPLVLPVLGLVVRLLDAFPRLTPSPK
jgi:hypothetical protein